jgi:hypothetical protein
MRISKDRRDKRIAIVTGTAEELKAICCSASVGYTAEAGNGKLKIRADRVKQAEDAVKHLA